MAVKIAIAPWVLWANNMIVFQQMVRPDGQIRLWGVFHPNLTVPRGVGTLAWNECNDQRSF